MLKLVKGPFMTLIIISFIIFGIGGTGYTYAADDGSEGTPEWSLEKTSIEAFLSENNIKVQIVGMDEDNYIETVHSDSDIVSVEDGYHCVFIFLNRPGTATITVGDKYGKTRTCVITVNPDPFYLNHTELNFDKYNDRYLYNEEEMQIYGNDDEGVTDNYIASFEVGDATVATVEKVGSHLEVHPVGPGKTEIVVSDQYGQTQTVAITVTQEFLDGMKHWENLSYSEVFGYDEGSVCYGDTAIYCRCYIAASVYTVINGKKYTGSVDEDGYYVIRGIPRLSAGSTIAVTFQKGQAKYVVEEKIRRKYGGSLPGSAKAQVYTGKALKPALTIMHGNITLKEGVDYKTNYSNNKNVGKGKATVEFIGNYTGAKAVYFKINPKPTSLIKVTAAKKGFSVKWKKQAMQTTGYQIQYSTKKTFKSSKNVTIKSSKKVSNKITKLKAKKKYFVRIRTYKKVGKSMYYSSWSTAKTVTTK